MEGHAWISVEVSEYGLYVAWSVISDDGLSGGGGGIWALKSLQRFVSRAVHFKRLYGRHLC